MAVEDERKKIDTKSITFCQISNPEVSNLLAFKLFLADRDEDCAFMLIKDTGHIATCIDGLRTR